MNGDEIEDRIRNKKAAMDMAREAAVAGDEICGGYFAFESLARQTPYGDFLVEFADYDMDDDSDLDRPY